MEFKIPMPWGHVAAKSYGSWHGQPLLAIHDWLDNSGSFDQLVKQLSRDIQFVVIDLPGHGLSSHVPLGIQYHRIDMVTVVKRIVEHQKWKKFSILGHGVGAEIAILYAASFPTLIKSLILVDALKPFSITPSEETPKLAAAIDQHLDLELKYEEHQKDPIRYTYDEAIQKIIDLHNGELSEESAKCLMARGAKQDSEGSWTLTTDIRAEATDTLRLNHDQCFNILKGLKGLPVLFLKTTNSPSWDLNQSLADTARNIYKAYAVFTEKEIEGNHYAHLSDSEKIAPIISEHILA